MDLANENMTTTQPPMHTTDSKDNSAYDDLKKERDAYMISMIVFIVLFVAEAGLASYLYIKSR